MRIAFGSFDRPDHNNYHEKQHLTSGYENLAHAKKLSKAKAKADEPAS